MSVPYFVCLLGMKIGSYESTYFWGKYSTHARKCNSCNYDRLIIYDKCLHCTVQDKINV